jgi:hypothetical protein
MIHNINFTVQEWVTLQSLKKFFPVGSYNPGYRNMACGLYSYAGWTQRRKGKECMWNLGCLNFLVDQ